MPVRNRRARQRADDAGQSAPVNFGHFKHYAGDYQGDIEPRSFIGQMGDEFSRLVDNFSILMHNFSTLVLSTATARPRRDINTASIIPPVNIENASRTKSSGTVGSGPESAPPTPTLKTPADRFYLVVGTITNHLATMRAVPIGDIDDDRQFFLRLRQTCPPSFLREPRLRGVKVQ
ncbi:hypothetical protein FALBO_13294 [Fusarium albosuccineum]|uniref:Uncharacterized protein n=1 Tax=Fusarium albosuccineum TaxID=1237068 RepID=A0A8H4P790_9HYPO|nr:hypothetical protein FALBO_13294 [Fusarium albosuccineum]